MLRTFTDSDQQSFGTLSADRNPAHTDALYARRLPNGRQIVHGVHLVLWAMSCAGVSTPRQIKAQFLRPVLVGDEVICEISPGGEASLYSRGELTTLIEFSVAEGKLEAPVSRGIPPSRASRELGLSEMEGRQGQETLDCDPELLEQLLPGLTPSSQVAILLSATRLVGMECPGLNSLLSEMTLDFSLDTAGPAFGWRVAEVDDRFARVDLHLHGAGWSGEISAFLRPALQPQPSMQTILRAVPSDAFSGQRALVVGGSRGLGECTAKILAAGGAEVVLTYKSGQADAARVVADIVAHGGQARCRGWDVTGEVEPDGWAPTHLYYFATPPIFVGSRTGFSPELFRHFCDYYVVGFQNTVRQVFQPGASLRVLYPSSVALDQVPREMCEYAAAKAAGETVCQFLMKQHSQLTIRVERLPRTLTDQTASIVPTKSAEPLELLLPILQEMSGA